jgi:hypothetical protein
MQRWLLLDAASGQSPGTLADKLSRCKAHLRLSYGGYKGYGVVSAVFALRSLGEGGPGTNFIEHYACRGAISLRASNLSECRILIEGRCAHCQP